VGGQARLPARIDTVVIGAGHAGLTMSWILRQGDRDHVVLDRRPKLGGGWLDRWDEFRLVTPNWTTSFPGYPYLADDLHGFMSRDGVAGRIAGYAEAIAAPVHLETEVTRVRPVADGLAVLTNQGEIQARNVVIAAGSFHKPRIPALAAELPASVTHLHSHAYRSPAELPDGAVLVVGSGQSGVQIAEELRDAGREVHLSVGSAGYAPRRYRGSDFFRWLAMLLLHGERLGTPLPTFATMPDPRGRLVSNPQLSGHRGGHDVNLRKLAAEGIHLIGRIERLNGPKLQLAGDLRARLRAADAHFAERYQPLFDALIAAAGLDAPPDDREPYTFEPGEPTELDLDRAGIRTVVWTSGYDMDFSWIEPPILDEMGFPRQRRGVTDVPGLYFLGLLWQHTQASSTLRGPVLDGAYLAGIMGITLPPPVIPGFLALPAS
jgi:putative flavoprotein involved in K+ transport